MRNPLNKQVTDSRDLLEFKEELEQEILDTYIEFAKDHNEFKEEETEDLKIPGSFDEVEIFEEDTFLIFGDLIEEYEDLKDFIEELETYSSDFQYGVAIIHESYFEDYCQEFVEDCGLLPSDLPAFIENNINWRDVAYDMRYDYAELEFDGKTYLIRQ